MNRTKVSYKILLMKSSGNHFIFLPVFYLIMWVMKASKNFGKIAILKIWELISLWDVKTYFGKLALKWCIFRHEKRNILTDIMSLLLIQLGFRHTKHFKMTVWISVLWKIFMYLAKKWPEMVIQWPFMSHNFTLFFLRNCKKLETKKKSIICHSFWSN